MRYLVNNKVYIVIGDRRAIQQALLVTHSTNAPTRLLENHQLLHHLFLVSVQETCEFARSQRSVQLQETPKGGNRELGPCIGDEILQMSLSRVNMRILKVCGQCICIFIRRGIRRNKLWARVREQLLECRDTLLSSRHLANLLAKSLLDNVQDVVIQSAGRQSVANREQGVHPIGGFVDLIVLVAPCVVLSHTKNQIQDSYECARRVSVSPEHHVAESDVVVGRDVACGYSGE